MKKYPSKQLIINRSQLIFCFTMIFSISCFELPKTVECSDQPNILWLYAEDTSPWMGCYGDPINVGKTPNIDGMASEGVLFKRAYVPAPVCSATRSAMMMGMSAIRFGAHQHRSSREGDTPIALPKGTEMLPTLMNKAGYTTFNYGKSDYNFSWSWNEYNHKLKHHTDFSPLITKQPFFGQIQIKGGKNNTSKFPTHRKVRPADVHVPADYPNNAIFRGVVAQHHDAIRMDDDRIGEILNGLKKTGLDQNTIVVYFSDHGANKLLRHKQMTTEGGLHVPFVIKGPQPFVPTGSIRTDLVSTLDLCATTLAWAGADIPSWYEGKDLFAKDFVERSFVAAHKDRLDHTIDRVRSLRTEDFRYVKNYKLDRILLQSQYRDALPQTINLHDLYKKGALSEIHRKMYFGERAKEELYHVNSDPAMIKNLAQDPHFAEQLVSHRELLDAWLAKGDHGATPESIQTLKSHGEGRPWGEGVNVEYEVYREDTDGDGLSDKWEALHHRDPQDGQLLFTFDSGAWQTEGWTSDDISSNLAGDLGCLEFDLDSTKGSIVRKGLNVTASPKDRVLLVDIKVNSELKLSLLANGQVVSSVQWTPSKKPQRVEMPLTSKSWKGTIEELALMFDGQSKSNIEIHNIKLR